MYTVLIKWRQFLPKHNLWVDQTLRTTDDAYKYHLERLENDPDIKDITVSTGSNLK